MNRVKGNEENNKVKDGLHLFYVKDEQIYTIALGKENWETLQILGNTIAGNPIKVIDTPMGRVERWKGGDEGGGGYRMSVKVYNCSNNNTIFNTKSWVEFSEKVEVALEKQTPKKPQKVDVDFSTFVCPNCLSTVTYTDEKETHNYCLNCGQKLDWRVEE